MLRLGAKVSFFDLQSTVGCRSYRVVTEVYRSYRVFLAVGRSPIVGLTEQSQTCSFPRDQIRKLKDSRRSFVSCDAELRCDPGQRGGEDQNPEIEVGVWGVWQSDFPMCRLSFSN